MFQFDVNEAIEHLRYSVLLDRATRGATALGVVCASDEGSHGAVVCVILSRGASPDEVDAGIDKAIAAAMDLNEATEKNGEGCNYFPVAVALPGKVMLEFLHDHEERKRPKPDVPND